MPQNVRVFGIRFFARHAYRGSILVGNIHGHRRTGPPKPLDSLHCFTVNSESVGLYEKFEITFGLPVAFPNPFDPGVVDVRGHFVSPSGKVTSVPGFFFQEYQRRLEDGWERLTPIGPLRWKVRFTPTEVGPHTYTVSVKAAARRDTPAQTMTTNARGFQVTPSSRKGFVRVSTRDWHYFEFTNGDFFFPIGHNVHAPYDFMYAGFAHTGIPERGGTHNYDRILPKMAKHKENFVEIWMAPWFLGLEWNRKHGAYRGLGQYNLEHAWKLDYLIEQAESLGLYVHLVLANHGQFSTWVDSEWRDNPYSVELGGFLKSPEEYFVNEKAIELFKRKTRYVVSRWGYSPHVLGIELWSEIDLTGDSWAFVHHESKVLWHQKIAPFLGELDPWRHPITSHYSSGYFRQDARLLSLPMISYTATDGYRADQAQNKSVVQIVTDTARFNEQFKKPTFITEFGGANSVDSPNVLEADLHCGLWASYMTTSAATPLFWWFHFIEERDKYFHYRALAEFDSGFDRRGKNLRPSKLSVDNANGLLMSQVLASEELALLWIYHRDLPSGKPDIPPVPPGASLIIPGLRDGNYRIEFWDTYAGAVTSAATAASSKGNLRLALPQVTKDIACKVLPQ
ncbi:MAG: DUF5060 domain-containing protein [Planctomycetes bacterium]|nr:DUF5060 domain-containing protein [Planctomycetota bacterium]